MRHFFVCLLFMFLWIALSFTPILKYLNDLVASILLFVIIPSGFLYTFIRTYKTKRR